MTDTMATSSGASSTAVAASTITCVLLAFFMAVWNSSVSMRSENPGVIPAAAMRSRKSMGRPSWPAASAVASPALDTPFAWLSPVALSPNASAPHAAQNPAPGASSVPQFSQYVMVESP